MNQQKFIINNQIKKEICIRIKKIDKILYDTSKRKKKTRGFCAFSGHITTACPTKMNIEQLIKDDDLIVLLKYKYSFRPIKNDEVGNIYRSIID